MKIDTVADLIVETLQQVGVTRVFGVVGDSLNGLTEALRRERDRLGPCAARGGRRLRGRAAKLQITGSSRSVPAPAARAICISSTACSMRIARRTPVLAIAAQIPSAEIGGGYFQETHPQDLFRECSHYCELVSDPRSCPTCSRMRSARPWASAASPWWSSPATSRCGRRPNAACRPMPGCCRRRRRSAGRGRARRAGRPAQRRGSVTLLCGRGCAGAHADLMRLAEALKSPIVHALGGKEYVEYDNPYDVGMTGLIGFSSGYARDACLRHAADAGHRLSLQAILPDRVPRSRRSTSGRRIWAALQARSRPRRRRRGHDRRRYCRGSTARATAAISTTAWRTTARPATSSTISPAARRAASRSTRNISRGSSATRRPRMRSSRPMSARRRSGPRATSR